MPLDLNRCAWQVRVTSPDFAEQLSKSKGLIASPSRGVVTQAVALGKPVRTLPEGLTHARRRQRPSQHSAPQHTSSSLLRAQR